MPEHLLALDVGTTTIRAALFTPRGDLRRIARAPARSRSPAPGLSEQDALEVWRSAQKVIAEALAAADLKPADVAAIGITSQRTSTLVWDRVSGAPLSPLVVWSDLRGAGRAGELRAEGFFLAPQQAAAKLEAVLAGVENASALRAQGRLAWGAIDSFLIWKLSGGAHVTDRSQAWPTGYLDPSTMDWNRALIDRQGLDEALFPHLVDTWGPIAETTPAAFGARVQITADVADQQSALIAHGDASGVAKMTYGTSATLDVSTGELFLYKSPTAPPFVVSFVDGAARFCIEAMVISAGSALDWLRGACNLGTVARFEALAASVPDAAGAAFLPALQGLGAPHGDAARQGMLTGLSPSVSRAHIAHAALQGVAFRAREAFDHVYAVTDLIPPPALGADGGLAADNVFLQIQADILGRPVRRHAILEATACGAAICAGRGAGLLSASDVRGFTRYGRTFEPRLSADEAQSRLDRWRAQVYG